MRTRSARFVGYGRELRSGPTLSEQVEALRSAGCLEDHIWTDEDGTARFRQLDLALMDAREGDIFVVLKLICLSSSYKRLSRALMELQSRNIPLRVLDEAIDTSGKVERMVIPHLLLLIEARQNIRSELIRDGLAAARMLGRWGGRRAVLSDNGVAMAREMLGDHRYTIAEIAERLGVSRSMLYKRGLTRRKRGQPRL